VSGALADAETSFKRRGASVEPPQAARFSPLWWGCAPFGVGRMTVRPTLKPAAKSVWLNGFVVSARWY